MFNGNELIEKMAVDSILFLISYQVQRAWVFGGGGYSCMNMEQAAGVRRMAGG